MEKKEEKKTTHRRLLVTLVLMMSLAWSMIAMAGKTGWQQEEGLWHFYDKDGVIGMNAGQAVRTVVAVAASRVFRRDQPSAGPAGKCLCARFNSVICISS